LFYFFLFYFRQRMQEENLIHRSYSAYLNDVNSPCSLFHNCFYSSETIDWLIKQQLCKTIYDGLEIFQVLEKLKIIHHGKWFLAFSQKKKKYICSTFFFFSLLLRLPFIINFACICGSTSA